MDISVDPLDTDIVGAMFSVIVDGASSVDVWLDYVRAHHPKVVDVLARAAMSDIAIEILVDHGDLTKEEAVWQRQAAAETASRMLPPGALRDVLKLKETLEMMESYLSRGDADVVDLRQAG
jgi:hypothetical protein